MVFCCSQLHITQPTYCCCCWCHCTNFSVLFTNTPSQCVLAYICDLLKRDSCKRCHFTTVELVLLTHLWSLHDQNISLHALSWILIDASDKYKTSVRDGTRGIHVEISMIRSERFWLKNLFPYF